MTLIACSRMYNVAPGARAGWDALFRWLEDASGIPLSVVAHAAPRPLSELWQRRDLGAVLMCGLPFIATPRDERPLPLGAPVAQADWAGGKPLYATHLVVAADSPFLALGDLRGRRVGWTARDSQSGYNALRHALVAEQAGDAHAFFGVKVGPLLNPNGVVDALNAGMIDVGPIDAYAYLLMQRHAPELVAGLRVVATTKPSPSPLLVAARGTDDEVLARLRIALAGAGSNAAARPALSALCLDGFAAIEVHDYAELLARRDAVARAGIAEW